MSFFGKKLRKFKLHSQSDYRKIKNFAKISTPSELHEFIKIISYNINLQDTIYLKKNINRIIKYIFSNHDNKQIDIVCLQGIQLNKNIINKLISQINIEAKIRNISLHLAPDFDHITNENKNDINYMSNYTHMNMIVSKFPIIDYSLTVINSDIFGAKPMVCANINYCGRIISIYNTLLSKNVNIAGINNKHIRKEELNKIISIIHYNMNELKDPYYDKYLSKDMHILLGDLYLNDSFLSDEMILLTQNYKALDIYKCLNENNPKINKYKATTTTGERNNFIFFILTNDIYDKNNKNNKLLHTSKLSDYNNIIFKQYKIYFIQMSVRQKICNNINFPIELVFLIQKYENQKDDNNDDNNNDSTNKKSKITINKNNKNNGDNGNIIDDENSLSDE